MNIGVLVARLVFGAVMAAHGSQKLVGWFGGYGIAGTGHYFESVGFRPGRAMAVAAGVTEAVSGVLVALGFLGPVGPALMLSVMIVASSLHWKNGLLATSNGIELPLLYSASAIALAFTGYGAYSLDALLGLTRLSTPGVAVAAILVGALAGAVNLYVRSLSATNPVAA